MYYVLLHHRMQGQAWVLWISHTRGAQIAIWHHILKR